MRPIIGRSGRTAGLCDRHDEHRENPWAQPGTGFSGGVVVELEVWEVAVDLDHRGLCAGGESAGAGVVDEVERAVGVAEEVDAWEGLLDLPATKGLDAVVVVVIGP